MCGVIGVYDPNPSNWDIDEFTAYFLRNVIASDATPQQIWLMSKAGYKRTPVEHTTKYKWEKSYDRTSA